MRWAFGVGALVAVGLLGVVVVDDSLESRTKRLRTSQTTWSVPVVDEAEAATTDKEAAQEKLPRYGWRRARRWDGRPAMNSTKDDEATATKNGTTPPAEPGSAKQVAKTKTKEKTTSTGSAKAVTAVVGNNIAAPPRVGAEPLLDSAGIVWIFSWAAGVYMMENEATVAQFDRCIAAGECEERKSTGTVVFPCTNSERKDIAADCVSWSNARRFCGWRGGQLPSKKQWQAEFTAAGQRGAPWGSEAISCAVANTLVTGGNYSDQPLAWCLGDTPSPPCAVSADVSSAGVCDMGGNLAEWVGWRGELRSLPEDFEAPYALNHGSTVSGLIGVRCVGRRGYRRKLNEAKPLKSHRRGRTYPPPASN